MGFFSSLFGGSAHADEIIQRFEQEIQLHRDQLFGITLFSQGLEVMYADQPEILEMNRQSFREITERAESAISGAEALLQRVKVDPAALRHIKRFKFPPISGHPMLDEMTQRAQILVRTYDQMFPNRPRSQPLDREDMEALMTAAADQL